jgi:hypothetical protein
MEHDGFRLLVDLGFATVPRLLERVIAAAQAAAGAGYDGEIGVATSGLALDLS